MNLPSSLPFWSAKLLFTPPSSLVLCSIEALWPDVTASTHDRLPPRFCNRICLSVDRSETRWRESRNGLRMARVHEMVDRIVVLTCIVGGVVIRLIVWHQKGGCVIVSGRGAVNFSPLVVCRDRDQSCCFISNGASGLIRPGSRIVILYLPQRRTQWIHLLTVTKLAAPDATVEGSTKTRVESKGLFTRGRNQE